MMTRLLVLILAFAMSAPAAAQYVQPAAPPAVSAQGWAPARDYVIAGQDEPGYRNWYMASPRHSAQVTAFNRYLTTWEVGGVVPTWQLLRTASMWQRCGAPPFEIPPTSEWPNVVQTLRYVRDYVIPAVGPVEPVSAYRNPILNACAGGAPQSSHQYFQAIDLVPLRPISRDQLMRTLCTVHMQDGSPYQVGLGFYAFLRFHIDSTRFRKWGVTDAGGASPCHATITRRRAPVRAVPVSTEVGTATPAAPALPADSPTSQSPGNGATVDPLAANTPAETPPVVQP